MKVYSESIISEMRPTKSNSSTALCVVEGPCMEFGIVNRNNRIYSRKLVEERILKNPAIIEALKNRSMLGEGGHPENRVDISYPEVALAVEKLWIPEGDGNMLWGRFAILDTPVGKILNTLVKYGTKLGISARAMADSVQKDGHEVILENSYELITFDAVPEPGFKCARLEKVESVSKPINKMSITELRETSAALKSFKNPVFESRIRVIDNEIKNREKLVEDNSLNESINKLSLLVDKASKSIQHIKYEKELISLIKEAKSLINKTYLNNRKNLSKNESIKNDIISIKYDDINVNRFNDNSSFNENININNIFNNEDKSTLERMCSNFRRNIYE